MRSPERNRFGYGDRALPQARWQLRGVCPEAPALGDLLPTSGPRVRHRPDVVKFPHVAQARTGLGRDLRWVLVSIPLRPDQRMNCVHVQ